MFSYSLKTCFATACTASLFGPLQGLYDTGDYPYYSEGVASPKLAGAPSECVVLGTGAVLGKFYSRRILCRIFLRRVKHLFAIYIKLVKFIIKSAKFYKNNANPQIAEANLGG